MSDSARPAAGTGWDSGRRAAPLPTVRLRGGASALSPDAQPGADPKGNGRRRAGEPWPCLWSEQLAFLPSSPLWRLEPGRLSLRRSEERGWGGAGPRPPTPAQSLFPSLLASKTHPHRPLQDVGDYSSSQEACPTSPPPNTRPPRPSPGYGASPECPFRAGRRGCRQS